MHLPCRPPSAGHITDITVLLNDEPCPPGYEKIRTCQNHTASLVAGTNAKHGACRPIPCLPFLAWLPALVPQCTQGRRQELRLDLPLP